MKHVFLFVLSTLFVGLRASIFVIVFVGSHVTLRKSVFVVIFPRIDQSTNHAPQLKRVFLFVLSSLFVGLRASIFVIDTGYNWASPSLLIIGPDNLFTGDSWASP
jgi:hypothetical protein